MAGLKVILGAAVAVAAALVVLPPMGRLGLAAALVAGMWLLRHVPARRRLVRLIAEAVDALSGAQTAVPASMQGITPGRAIGAARGRKRRPVSIRRWRGSEPVGPVTVRYSPRFRDGEPSRRAMLERVVAAKCGGAWEADWRTRANRVVLHRVPELPAHVDYTAPAEPRPHLTPVGMGDGGRVVSVDWRRTAHLLVCGQTGSCKSRALMVVCAGLLAYRRNQLVGVDVKRLNLRHLRGRPGVLQVATDLQDAAAAVRSVRDTMDARYRLLEAGRPCDTRPLFLVVDELAELVQRAREGHRGKGGEPPLVHDLRAIIRLGRETDCRVVATVQRPDTHLVGGGEARDQYGAVLVCGPLSPDGSAMALGDRDAGPAIPGIPGRALLAVNGARRHVQVYDLADPDRWLPPRRPVSRTPAGAATG